MVNIFLYFAAYKKHIGFYHGLIEIEDAILEYRANKGKLAFSVGQTFAYYLVEKK